MSGTFVFFFFSTIVIFLALVVGVTYAGSGYSQKGVGLGPTSSHIFPLETTLFFVSLAHAPDRL